MIRKGLIWSVVALIIMLGIILWTDGLLPEGEKIPVHFDITGAPDRYGLKSEAMLGLWIIWGSTVFTAALLAGLPKIMPRQANLEKSGRAYLACWLGVLVLMVIVTGIISWTMVQGATSGVVGSGPIKLVLIGMSALYIVMGNYLPKTRSNWLIGIRTPWTLSSDTSWEKTHRLTGKLFLLAGVLTMFAAIFMSLQVALVISIGSIFVAAIIGVIYSWWIWRSADDRSDNAKFIE